MLTFINILIQKIHHRTRILSFSRKKIYVISFLLLECRLFRLVYPYQYSSTMKDYVGCLIALLWYNLFSEIQLLRKEKRRKKRVKYGKKVNSAICCRRLKRLEGMKSIFQNMFMAWTEMFEATTQWNPLFDIMFLFVAIHWKYSRQIAIK